MRLALILLLALAAVPGPAEAAPAAAARAARGMEFDTYIRLQPGMTEGELIYRAGPPDHFSVDDVGQIVKTFYYYPTRNHPFITVVTVRGGVIDRLERTKQH